MTHRLAILSTHPIQYNAPFFRLLAAIDNIELQVYYSRASSEVRYDPKFRQEVVWDVPLTTGYSCETFQASSPVKRAEMIEAIRDFNPQAIIIYGWNFPGHLDVIKGLKRTTQIWFRGDSTVIDPMHFGRKWARRLWLSWVYNSIDRALYVGEANRRYFRFSNVPEHKLVHLPHAVDVHFFQSEDTSRKAAAKKIRHELGISEQAKVFLFVGKLEPLKQPLQLFESFVAALQFAPDTDSHLVFVGDGELHGVLNDKASQYANVHVVGFVNQSNMPIYYRLGDCLCLPSQTETWGLSVNEYLASNGRELILSDRVGCSEEFSHFPQCRIVQHDNYRAWTETIIESFEYSKIDDALPNYCNSKYNFEISKSVIRRLLQSNISS